MGWRIDYFTVSERLRSRIENADIDVYKRQEVLLALDRDDDGRRNTGVELHLYGVGGRVAPVSYTHLVDVVLRDEKALQQVLALARFFEVILRSARDKLFLEGSTGRGAQLAPGRHDRRAQSDHACQPQGALPL